MRTINGVQKEKCPRKSKQTSQSTSQSGFESTTRLHKVRIASVVDQNAMVNTFPSLAHTACHVMRWVEKEVSNLTFERELTTLQFTTKVKS